ncbi:FtsX-like permease family protein [Ponticaulis sp.]|uniref:ABC transporter permease n=1 Tax=Ponticaulis sp. TaxID=2020902 RepID=UPI000C47A5D8|nr:FtsX-like permease family protein [Ponticaulis sp.]MBL4641050.1 FtsX-like permease family protein [Verrucomicrobiales bacterium]MBN06115.1 ABC transporter permease [Ponticaulis sp.]
MSPLDKKLLRDLWRIKGQALAIGAVIGVGVLMLVMMTGLVTSLDETRRAYYERHRLADVFVPLVRAPERMEARLAEIPGVASAEGRISGSAQIDLSGEDLPLQARIISLPENGEPQLNEIYLTDGRRLDEANPDEIILLKSFADARGLLPGDALTLTIRGGQREFQIVGLARSPEFLYVTAPGEIAPDDARYAVIWMGQATAAAAFDMSGAFNEALVSLTRDAREPAVIESIDQLVRPYGGLGAYGLEDHFSDRYVSEEISGLRGTSAVVPPVFLAVAAFLLYIVISRMVQAERSQIGLIKAFGYTDLEVGAHYFKLILVIAVSGALLGCLGGIASGRSLVNVYVDYFKFPFLLFEVKPSSFILGILVSVLSASAGGLLVLRQVFALTPAVAMRPAAPADYSASGRIGQSIFGLLDQPSRMVLRRITRQPGRMAGAALGVAAGMGLATAMTAVMGGFDRSMDLTFGVIDRSDVTVSFVNPVSNKVVLELGRMPGVIEVEPARNVSVVLRNGTRTHRGALEGRVRNPRLNRAITPRLEPIEMRQEGIIIATSLAQKLAITPGEILTVEVKEGRQPVLQIPVVGTTQSLLGSPAYIEIDALNRAMREPGRISAASLRVDSAQSDAIYRRLKGMPAVVGVSLKENARESLQRMMDTGAGAMRFIMAGIAFVITFGIVYNSARIAQAERERDLASLRVLGFSKGEAAFVLLGELVLVTFIALPVGALIGFGLSSVIAEGFSSDLYQIPAAYGRADIGIGALAVLVATLVSAWLVKRDVDRTELITALKSRE